MRFLKGKISERIQLRPSGSLLPMGLEDLFHLAIVDWGLIMADGMMITIPALLFFVTVQQYLIHG